MGESAGATLAAVTCLAARDNSGPRVSHQALIYPAVDMAGPDASAAAGASTPFLSAAEMAAYNRLYLGPDGDAAHPWASPLRAADHAGLPPALVQVGEHDPLRDGGKRYAAALRAAGVPVRLTEYVGMPHGFVNFPGLARPRTRPSPRSAPSRRPPSLGDTGSPASLTPVVNRMVRVTHRMS